MNDDQIVEYCRNLISANLSQYAEQNPSTILAELYELDNDETNQTLLAHCQGVKELLEKCIKILENQNDKNK